jgi:hypothetical protein
MRHNYHQWIQCSDCYYSGIAHNLDAGRIVTFDNAGSFTSPDTDYVPADFDDVLFEIQNTTTTTFTILNANG